MDTGAADRKVLGSTPERPWMSLWMRRDGQWMGLEGVWTAPPTQSTGKKFPAKANPPEEAGCC